MNQPSSFEKKIAQLREELDAFAQSIITAHTHTGDESDLDVEIANVTQWRKDIESVTSKS